MKTPKNLNTKFCKDCLISLNENNTNKYDIVAAQYVCKRCRKIRDKKRYENRRELIRSKQRMYDLSVKIKIIMAYGGKCECCGENNIEFLTIDHIHNNGAQDRKNNGNKLGGKLYRWLIKNNFPKDEYQLLCYNCNCSKGFFGYCPHKKPDIIPQITRNTHPNKN
jgi:hypothetical protein